MPVRKPPIESDDAPTHRPIQGWDGEDTLFASREAEVLNLRANGNTYAEISDLLGITRSEVGTYVTRINRKILVAKATLDAARDYLAFAADDD